MMKKIGFVLLHYNNIEVTREAVSYILKLNKEHAKISIVIVDNASPNESGVVIKEEYKNNQDIQVILLDNNIGFSKGNNIGYNFLRNEGHYDFIIVMNTDVFIQDTEFLNKLLAIKTDAQIIGPDILTKTGNHQNPFRIKAMDNVTLRQLYDYNHVMAMIYRIPIVGSMVMTVLEAKSSRVVKANKNYSDIEMEDVVLHGSCIIYTKSWIEREKIAFLPITFMYVEEDILMEYVRKKGYHTLYSPFIHVLHKEDASLNGSFKSRLKKRIFLADNMSASAHELIQLRMNEVNQN